jgi:hypothetical protein
MITSRLGTDGRYNVGYGLDAQLRLFGEDYLTIRWAQTFTDTTANRPLSLDPARFMIQWERRKLEGFTYFVVLTYSGTDFEPGIGLEVFQDYFATREEVRYDWISPEDSKLQNHYLNLMNYHINDVRDGTLLILRTSPGWTFQSKSGWMGNFSVFYNYECLKVAFEILEPVSVPTGKYTFMSSVLRVHSPTNRSFFTGLSLEGGGFYDGQKISPSLESGLTLGASLELGGIYRFDHVRFPERQQVLSNHIVGVRGLYMLSTKISFSAFVQYNTAVQKVVSNFRFRYNPREGTDLYLVFNEGRNALREREVPVLPAFEERSLTLKFTYTFRI